MALRKFSCVALGTGWKLLHRGQRYLFTGCIGSPRLQVPNVQQLDLKDTSTAHGIETEETKQVINPLRHRDFFGVRDLFTLEDLFNARVHLGHKAGLRNPHMQPFVFGNRLGVDIIDLEQTVPMLQDALNFIAHIAFRQGIVLFVSRNHQMMPLIQKTAHECGEYAHCRFWRGGTFTNMTVQFGAITRLPDLCVFVTTQNTVFEQHVAVIESSKMNVPTVGVVDTSCDPRLITYPIPGNDDSPAAIELYCRLFKEAVLKGKEKYEELAKGKQS